MDKKPKETTPMFWGRLTRMTPEQIIARQAWCEGVLNVFPWVSWFRTMLAGLWLGQTYVYFFGVAYDHADNISVVVAITVMGLVIQSIYPRFRAFYDRARFELPLIEEHLKSRKDILFV